MEVRILMMYFFYNSLAYLSTDFGVVVLNPARKEIKETYVLQVGANIAKINAFTLYKGNFLAASNLGLFSADENLPVLQDYTKWSVISNWVFTQLNSHPTDYIFGAVDTTMLFSNSSFISNWDTIGITKEPVVRLLEGAASMYFLENGDFARHIYRYDLTGKLEQQYNQLNALDLTEVRTRFLYSRWMVWITICTRSNVLVPVTHQRGPIPILHLIFQ